MDTPSILTTIQHIHMQKIMHNYHQRHYVWEVAKILVPALLTGMITFIAMRIIDNKNKKRWLNDGHLRRKTDLEIEIRKILLGVKASTSGDYEILANWYDKRHEEDVDKRLIISFYKDFASLCKYLKIAEAPDESNTYQYKKIFALMDEYECYTPKIKNLFVDFKRLYTNIFELKDLSDFDGNILEEVKKSPEHFDSMVNAYLCFQLVVENILKKITIKKLK